jgi:hypothetical protein
MHTHHAGRLDIQEDTCTVLCYMVTIVETDCDNNIDIMEANEEVSRTIRQTVVRLTFCVRYIPISELNVRD